MTTANQAHSEFIADDQVLELAEDQLDAVEGGFFHTLPTLINTLDMLYHLTK